MKKVLLVMSAAVLLYACGGEGTKAPETTATPETKTTPAAAAAEEKGLNILASLDCTTCHKINEKSIGPAYMDVSKKYEATEANIDSLAHKVIKGGTGVWGTVPMTPHPNLSLDSAREVVKYVLSLKNAQ
ncbi:MAG: c-type cytochrome [Chitinophagaceae bacterium]|mgnify:CR=1 FL=1|nr:c-type cytochrome [Chitinophagaceae bacterium]